MHVWICRFPLPLGVWEGLRFVIVALPGLFSYLFLFSLKLWKHILFPHKACIFLVLKHRYIWTKKRDENVKTSLQNVFCLGSKMFPQSSSQVSFCIGFSVLSVANQNLLTATHFTFITRIEPLLHAMYWTLHSDWRKHTVYMGKRSQTCRSANNGARVVELKQCYARHIHLLFFNYQCNEKMKYDVYSVRDDFGTKGIKGHVFT